ncbi:hypothetical protein Dvina_09425 [Dactylosporangium vinaceum]|uniref:Glycosyltransferase RgtA/B/C/D-like domain-containing protein n=1 Tax=Dactylosporangium vinaceum TaxID=53362 RepID=A0ABV5MAZ9_9ACTN|nr:hypothetical protein [Dactylosporangium vinaceum]UAB98282.1 hypothetical protein Dvina_09425 [Dactylosporangium vinaceum]
MTTTVERRTPVAPAASRTGWRIPAWVPPAALTGLVAVGLEFYGVPFPTTAIFLLYLLGGIVAPGTLIWRAVRGRSGWIVEDLGAGLALGYAGEVLAYIPARAIGLPLLVLVWPVAVIGAFLAVPPLRRFWRFSSDARDRTPLWWSLTLSATAAVVFYWSCVRFFRTHDLREPGMLSPDADSPFHLALIGDAKHHMPLLSPWLSDQPVLYHWFVYAEMAATSWVTGIEPHVLLVRLGPMPMLFGLVALLGVIGRRLTGVWWAGAAAAVITFFVLTPMPYHWPLEGWFSAFGTNAFEDGSSLRAQLWTSPTQTFGALLFAGLALALIEALAGHTRARWLLVTVLIAAVTGAKATFLPMLLAGLLLVVAVRLITRRRVHPGALYAAGVTLLGLLFAQFVLFGGASQGMAIDPLHFAQISGAPYTLKFAAPEYPHPLWRLLVVTLLTVLCWACIWPGLLGLGRLAPTIQHARRVRRDLGIAADPVIAMFGIGLSGVGALMVFGHEAGAEGWFMVSARPYLSLASVVGLVLLTPRGLPDRPMLRQVSLATGAGAAVLLVVHKIGSMHTPKLQNTGSLAVTTGALIWPYLLAYGLLGAAGYWIHRHRAPVWRTLVCAMLAGACMITALQHVYLMTRASYLGGWRGVVQIATFVTPGTQEAGRWLRDHSDPDDLVATNAHCVGDPYALTGCDNRHFWFSAYSERRFLVEGWGFTNRAHEEAARAGVNAIFAPYWDPQKLADNDAAFYHPTASTVGLLRDKYHVKWLMVDEGYLLLPSTWIQDYAQFRYRAGRIAVYEMRG